VQKHWSKNNEWIEGRSNNHTLSFKKGISIIYFQHYNTSYGASSGGGGVVWPYAYLVDVPHGKNK
jgi:hypothetical protein